jgi:hypothetical protein
MIAYRYGWPADAKSMPAGRQGAKLLSDKGEKRTPKKQKNRGNELKKSLKTKHLDGKTN